MMLRCAGLVILLVVFAASCSSEQQPPRTPSAADRSDFTADQEIRVVLDRYVQAVNDADSEVLREIWADVDDVTFINPLARFHSWDELQGFWQGVIQGSFTQRAFTPQNVTIRGSGDVAWAVFDWEFNATQIDGTPYRGRGWETQIYHRTDQGWRISHVHYSVPVPPPASDQ